MLTRDEDGLGTVLVPKVAPVNVERGTLFDETAGAELAALIDCKLLDETTETRVDV